MVVYAMNRNNHFLGAACKIALATRRKRVPLMVILLGERKPGTEPGRTVIAHGYDVFLVVPA